jgi:DNA transposition AAA+ family ATPase
MEQVGGGAETTDGDRAASDRTPQSESVWDEELRQWLSDYIAAHSHHPTAVLSRSHYIGIARIALDAYLAGTYFLPKEQGGQGANPVESNLEEAIRAFRDRIEGTARHKYANNFTETRTYAQLEHACETAINENVITVCYGRPGIGKSRCLMEFAARKMVTPPISILCSRNITAAYFASVIAERIGIAGDGPLARLDDRLGNRLRRSPRPLFVDQANYLPEQALGTICHSWEIARIPIVLVGTKSLHDLFFKSKLTQDVRAQISSRIALHYPLAELTPKEAKAIIQRGLGTDATDEVVAQIYNVTEGVYRHVEMILPRIIELKSKNHLELEEGTVKMQAIINIAGSRLMI